MPWPIPSRAAERALPWVLLLAALAQGAGAADARRDTDPETGLARWTFQDGALSLQLIQRLPDQTRAFFLGRGFTPEAADAFAGACVFQTILRNAAAPGGPTLGLDLTRWGRIQEGPPAPLPLEPDWQPRWEAAGLTPAARIAFRWSLFPVEQAFRPGDYNWGMVPFGPAPGERFALRLVWTEDGTERTGVVEDVLCAVDP